MTCFFIHCTEYVCKYKQFFYSLPPMLLCHVLFIPQADISSQGLKYPGSTLLFYQTVYQFSGLHPCWYGWRCCCRGTVLIAGKICLLDGVWHLYLFGFAHLLWEMRHCDSEVVSCLHLIFMLIFRERTEAVLRRGMSLKHGPSNDILGVECGVLLNSSMPVLVWAYFDWV